MGAEESAPSTHEPGLELRVIWVDEGLIELSVRASNGRFAGCVELYVDQGRLAAFSRALRGFPASGRDRRELELGTLDPARAGGGVRLGLRCTDALGHVAMSVELRADPRGHAGAESAAFGVRLEPAAIDAFVAQLERLEPEVGACAQLRA